MTQVERLIRNLCEEKRLQIVEQERERIKAVLEEEPWRDLTPLIQRTVLELRTLDKREAKLKARLTKAGYHTHYNLRVGHALHRTGTEDEKRAVRIRAESRRIRVSQLRTGTTIDTLGKTAVEASKILQTLKAQLAKI